MYIVAGVDSIWFAHTNYAKVIAFIGTIEFEELNDGFGYEPLYLTHWNDEGKVIACETWRVNEGENESEDEIVYDGFTWDLRTDEIRVGDQVIPQTGENAGLRCVTVEVGPDGVWVRLLNSDNLFWVMAENVNLAEERSEQD